VEALEVKAAALNMVVAVAVVHAQALHKRAWVVVALALAVLVAVVVECQMVSRVARVAQAQQGPWHRQRPPRMLHKNAHHRVVLCRMSCKILPFACPPA